MANTADTDARRILAAVEEWAKKECTDLRIERGHVVGKVIVRAHLRFETSDPAIFRAQEKTVNDFAEKIDKKLDRKPEYTLVQKVKNSPAMQITFML